MPKQHDQTDKFFSHNVKQICHCLLAVRRNQDKIDADFLASLGTLNTQQLNVLNIIGDNQPCAITTIAYTTSLPLGSSTLLIDKLVRKKLVKRERSKEDQRVSYATLTDQGMEIYQKQINQMEMWVAVVLSTLSPSEQDVLVKFMQRFSMSVK